jgi:hypothetical protein
MVGVKNDFIVGHNTSLDDTSINLDETLVVLEVVLKLFMTSSGSAWHGIAVNTSFSHM